MECPSCKADIPNTSRFCSECGKPVPRRCAACGASSRAAAKFCVDCGATLAPDAGRTPTPDATLGSATSPLQGVSLAERRHLTVMFCDLVGSTALSSSMDPEELQGIITAYQGCVAKTVSRFDGFVAKYMGDGVLVYFGYPRAHEDDAERAVRSGLMVVDVVGRLKLPTNARLAVRVGIATGLVVVGETVGEGWSLEQAVVGETPNLAARLQGFAEPNAVVIADHTRDLLGGIFDLDDLGPRLIRGMPNPVRSWRVVGEHEAESRFEARQTPRATGFFGRDREVDLLLDRWAHARNGEGQVVLLSGGAGIGKSRIIAALRQRIVDEACTRIQYQCSPHHTSSPFYPVITQLERAAGFAPDDTVEAKLDKLERVLKRSLSRIDHIAPLIALLLSLPFEQRYAAPEFTPQRLKDHTIAALIDLLDGLAKRGPVLFILEDAHWIDPTTLELFSGTIEKLQHWPVLLMATFRPEFAEPWGHYPHVTSLALNRLTERHVMAMIAQVTHGKNLPAEVQAEIITKTDGVPLFVEELTKAVLGSGLLSETADSYMLRSPLPPLAIPATLHDSLLARLDRLASVREVAQIGSAIGREFSYQLLDAVAPVHGRALNDALDEIGRAELIFARGTPPEASYTFKHALVQDAAYGSLLNSFRRHLHGRIAHAIMELMPQTVQTQPELLAWHYAQAGLIDDAITYVMKAGQRSAAHSANEEAITHYNKALTLLATKPEGVERDRQEIDLLVALGVPTMAAPADCATRWPKVRTALPFYGASGIAR